MQIDATTSAIGAAAVAGFFTSIAAIGVTWITKRSDERRHRREVAFNLAMEHYKSECERAKWTVENHPGTKVTVASIDTYIIRAAVLSDMLGSRPTRCNIAKKLRRAQAIYDAAGEQTQSYSEALKQRRTNDASSGTGSPGH